MATYKTPCMQCSSLIDGSVHFCPYCGSRNPFGYHCPTCLKSIERGQLLCTSCGRKLVTPCPYCDTDTFIGSDRCDSCGQTLLIKCENKRCNEMQFFENTKCTACGKPIKTAKKQIEAIKKSGGK
jgi:RNA polymerase subunit RPABC4/transcription elongation factor Spt4